MKSQFVVISHFCCDFLVNHLSPRISLLVRYTRHRFAQKVPTLSRPFYKHLIPVSRSAHFIAIFHLRVYTRAVVEL